MHLVISACLICLFCTLLVAGLLRVLRDMLGRDLGATATAFMGAQEQVRYHHFGERRKDHRYGIDVAVPRTPILPG